MPINPNIATKSNYALRPSVPSNQKQNADEFNLLVLAVKSNYERLILAWSTDIAANITLAAGQYILFTDNLLYRITTSYNVGNPATWDSIKATAISSAHFKGVYASEAALTVAHPTAQPGDYALVDIGASEAELWIWDDTDSEWVASGVTTVVPSWDDTTQGIVERSTTAEAQNIITRTAAGSSDASNSDARTPSEKGLVEMLLSFLAGAWTWAAKQTFSVATRFNSVIALDVLAVDSNKDLIGKSFATLSSDLGLPASRAAVSVSSGTLTLDFDSKYRKDFDLTTTQSSNFAIAFSNASNLMASKLFMRITGTVDITFPTSPMNVIMGRHEEVGARWTTSTNVLRLIGTTASPFMIEIVPDSAGTQNFWLFASERGV